MDQSINSTPVRPKTIHVICIGGSGLRILRSFIMLLSSGYDIPGYKVKPYIVDPHLQSEDLKRATELITWYQEIYSSDNAGFFRVPLEIENINKLNAMEAGSEPNQSFGDFIGYQQISSRSDSKAVIDILYNGINITKSMSVGFKGSPNVGSVVFKDFVQGTWFQNHLTHLSNDDRVIVIGSLFGGTGASGIPAIAKALKTRSPQLKIAAIALTPYFKLHKPDPNATDKEIDSETFEAKSLAALNFYSNNDFGIDSFYVIGDSGCDNYYQYDEATQGNLAHFIEMVAATAIKEFAGTPEASMQPWNMFFTADLQSTMLYDHCNPGLKEVSESLANFYAFSKFLHLMRNDRQYPFNKRFYHPVIKSPKTADRMRALDRLIYSEDPAMDSFIRWMGEMRDNTRSFNAVNTEDILSPEGQIQTYRFAPQTPNPVFNGTEKLSRTNMSDYFLAINDIYRQTLKKPEPIDSVAKFLNICHRGIIKVNSKE